MHAHRDSMTRLARPMTVGIALCALLGVGHAQGPLPAAKPASASGQASGGASGGAPAAQTPAAPKPAPAGQTPARATQIESSEVNAIVADVIVRDRNNNPVTDLTVQDFEIYEDGVRQEIGSFTPVSGAPRELRTTTAADTAGAGTTKPEAA